MSVTASDASGSEETETTHARLQRALEEKGELMVRTVSGETYELHKHNVSFGDAPFVQLDADDETYWLDASCVEAYWLHRDV